MSPFLEEYAHSIGAPVPAPRPRPRRPRQPLPLRKVSFVPYEQRPCFICGSPDACRHREPELLIMAVIEEPRADS